MLLMFAPAPIRKIASSPLGSRILLTVGTGLLATGAMTINWENGTPSFQFHKDKFNEAKQEVTDELHKQGITWQNTPQGMTFQGQGEQIPISVQQLPGFIQQQQGYGQPQPYPPPQFGNVPNTPPGVYPPNAYPPNAYPPNNGYPPNTAYATGQPSGPQWYPPQNPTPQNPAGFSQPQQNPGAPYGYGQAQGPVYPPGYRR